MILAVVFLAMNVAPVANATETIQGSGIIRCHAGITYVAASCSASKEYAVYLDVGQQQSVSVRVEWDSDELLHTEVLQLTLTGNRDCLYEPDASPTCHFARVTGTSPLELELTGLGASDFDMRAILQIPAPCSQRPFIEPPHLHCSHPPISIAYEQPFHYTWTLR